MNKYTIGTLSALGVLSVAALSSLSFAASTGSTLSQVGNAGNGSHMEHRMEKRENILSNSGVVTALKTAGLTAPTETEMKARMDAMKTTQDQIAKLSTDDQTALKSLRDSNRTAEEALRDANAAKEREFLRSKGVSVPTEAEVAKAKQTQDVIRKALEAQGIAGGKGPQMGGEMGGLGGKQGPHGKMGGAKGQAPRTSTAQ